MHRYIKVHKRMTINKLVMSDPTHKVEISKAAEKLTMCYLAVLPLAYIRPFDLCKKKIRIKA